MKSKKTTQRELLRYIKRATCAYRRAKHKRFMVYLPAGKPKWWISQSRALSLWMLMVGNIEFDLDELRNPTGSTYWDSSDACQQCVECGDSLSWEEQDAGHCMCRVCRDVHDGVYEEEDVGPWSWL